MNRTIPEVPHLATALTGPLQMLEKHFLANALAIESWFRQQWLQTPPTFYSSVDLRNAGFKVAPIDTNLFPAGFNNLNPDFFALCVQAVQATIAEICPKVTRLLIIPESHSRNIFYFESLATLVEILKRAGFAVEIGMLDPMLAQTVTLPSGRSLALKALIRRDDRVGVEDFFPCCIILNNDLSNGVPDILNNLTQTLLPAKELGWFSRLKSQHFHLYDQVCDEFSKIIQLDPWLINPYFSQCPEVDFMQKHGQECLKTHAEELLQKIQKKYQEYNIQQKPFLIIKADAGTYGMAVMTVQDPEEIMTLNRKQRTHMSTIKGGVTVTKVLIQEGVHTFETVGEDKAVAEPVVYMIGRHVVGGFYRLHKNRGIDQSLNTPGMDFKPLAFAQTCQTPHANCTEPENRFYAYGVVARLASLAAARELALVQPRKAK